jgi:hypothetical protein
VNREPRPPSEVRAALAEEHTERLRSFVVADWIRGDYGRAAASAEALWQDAAGARLRARR